MMPTAKHGDPQLGIDIHLCVVPPFITQKGWIGDPLTVLNRDGRLVSFDNRRLDAARELGMKEVPVNIVNGSDPYPKSTTGKTWDDAFNERLKKNGLGQYGTLERPAVGKTDGAERVARNRRSRVGCAHELLAQEQFFYANCIVVGDSSPIGYRLEESKVVVDKDIEVDQIGPYLRFSKL